MTDTPTTVADIDAHLREAREAELRAWNADHSGQALKYRALQDTLLDMRPMAALAEQTVDHGAAPVLA